MILFKFTFSCYSSWSKPCIKTTTLTFEFMQDIFARKCHVLGPHSKIKDDDKYSVDRLDEELILWKSLPTKILD